jgi:hypothetical protein
LRNVKALLKGRWTEIARFLPNARKCSKAIVKPLGAIKKVWESRWKIPRGYWIASEQSLKAAGKPLGRAQITQIAAGLMFLLAGCDEKKLYNQALSQ